MSIVPYTPTPFTTPVANPAVGGSGTPYPYISVSEYMFAPTAVDTQNLNPQGSGEDQIQSLSDVIRRASSTADQYLFGADPSAKGASLCATLSVETGLFPILKGELRLICDYKPIVQVNGIDIGPSMGNLTSIGNTLAGQLRIGRRIIHVPVMNYAVRAGDTGNPNWNSGYGGNYVAVWSYVNGYPHTLLNASVVAGTSTISVLPTDGGTGLLGIINTQTQMTIVDGSYTERFTVQSVSGTTITSTTPFQFNHTLPSSPDTIPVTTLPGAVNQAVIFLTTALIKTEGNAALVLDGMNSPKEVEAAIGGWGHDVEMACKLLHPYKIHVKAKN